MIFKNILIITCFSMLTASCAQTARNIDPDPVPSSKFANFSCDQISIEIDYIEQRVSFLTGVMEGETDSNNLQTAMSVLLLAPISGMVFKSHSDRDAKELAELKGNYIALRDASIIKDCDIKPLN